MVDSELHAMLASDERHWWYRGRRRILRAELDRLELPPGARILDAGSGSGRTLDELATYGSAAGVDLSAAAVAAARARGHEDVRLGALERLPYPAERFDLVTCLDVLEHVPDDVAALREIRRVTRPGGRLLVTVPAYPLLWSAHDERNLHYRRYGWRALRDAAEAAGWEPVRTTHFNTLLLAPAAAVRLAQRAGFAPADGSDLERTSPALDRLLELPLRLEAELLRRGGRLPVGLSLLAVFAASRQSVRQPSPYGREHVAASAA